VVEAIRGSYADVTVVLVTAPSEILGQRLAARARSSDGPIESRLHRVVDGGVAPDVTIVNVGDVKERARGLVNVIRGIADAANHSGSGSHVP
jgi:ribose 1,5-bisphosphokinase